MRPKKRHLRPPPAPPPIPLKRGGQPGNTNALKHGKCTRERRALFAAVRAHIQRGRALLAGGTEGAKEVNWYCREIYRAIERLS